MAQPPDSESSRQSGNPTPSHERLAGTSDTQNSSVVDTASRERAINYWTAERMRKATPMELSKADPDEVRRTAR